MSLESMKKSIDVLAFPVARKRGEQSAIISIGQAFKNTKLLVRNSTSASKDLSILIETYAMQLPLENAQNVFYVLRGVSERMGLGGGPVLSLA